MRRDIGYGLGRVLKNCQEQPRRLEWVRSMEDDFNSTTHDEVAKLAKEYLSAGRHVTIGLAPEKKP